MILVDREIHFVLLKEIKDTEERMMCAHINREFAGNMQHLYTKQGRLFHEVINVLREMDGQIILAGDFNQVIDPILDKSQFKGLLKTKDSEAIHTLKDDMMLVHVWRLTNPPILIIDNNQN